MTILVMVISSKINTQQILMQFKPTPLKIGILTAGILGLGYVIKQLMSQQQSKAPAPPKVQVLSLSLPQTKQIMQEIKYQMLSICISYLEKVSRRMLQQAHPSELESLKQKLKAKIIWHYENKQRVTLERHKVSKEEYHTALAEYSQNQFIMENSREIIEMMEKSCSGEHPDLTVTPMTLTVNSSEEMKDIYQEICIIIGKQVWKVMKEFSQSDPSFDTGDNAHFKKAVFSIDIYQLRIDFLTTKGYKSEWGCPNQVFLKAVESVNKDDDDFRRIIRNSEQAYGKLIDIVSNSPLSVNESDIKPMFHHFFTLFQEARPVSQPESQITSKPNNSLKTQ